MAQNKNDISFLERLGRILVVSSIIGFAVAVVLSCIPASVTFKDGKASMDVTYGNIPVKEIKVGKEK